MRNKKWIITFSVLVLVVLIVGAIGIFVCLGAECKCQDCEKIVNKPKIVDFFACGDNCPGDRSQYLVKVYEGVDTKEECEKYGGEFKSFVGWGTTYYCEVTDDESEQNIVENDYVIITTSSEKCEWDNVKSNFKTEYVRRSYDYGYVGVLGYVYDNGKCMFDLSEHFRLEMEKYVNPITNYGVRAEYVDYYESFYDDGTIFVFSYNGKLGNGEEIRGVVYYDVDTDEAKIITKLNSNGMFYGAGFIGRTLVFEVDIPPMGCVEEEDCNNMQEMIDNMCESGELGIFRFNFYDNKLEKLNPGMCGEI